jgi:hypothetical protein
MSTMCEFYFFFLFYKELVCALLYCKVLKPTKIKIKFGILNLRLTR